MIAASRLVTQYFCENATRCDKKGISKMKQRYICPKRSKVCRQRKCKAAYAHTCKNYNESHGCILYISQPFCEKCK